LSIYSRTPIFSRIHIRILYQPPDKPIGSQHNLPPQNGLILKKQIC